MNSTVLTGGCLCGAVTYEVAGDALRFYHCHCRRCRKATGAAHASNLIIQPATLRWLTGGAYVRAFKVPDAQRFTNQFCEVCGGRLPRQPPGSDRVVLPAGSLDVDPPMLPRARIFMDSRADWSCSGDGLPEYPEYAPS